MDPLSDVIGLLQPGAIFSKGISGKGAWAVRYSEFGHPSFCAVLQGSCRLAIDGVAPVTLAAGDFVLMPATPGFTLSSLETSARRPIRPIPKNPAAEARRTDDVRHGESGGSADVRLLGGHFVFGAPDSDLLVRLLPRMAHVQGAGRLATLVEWISDESRNDHPGRELVTARLADVMLIEALRASTDLHAGPAANMPPGLLRGLADERLAMTIRSVHATPAQDWTVERMAREAALSRSAFFERFTRSVGVTPMGYVQSWRMAVARSLLRAGVLSVGAIAERIGYGSASTFSTAFSRRVGQSPSRYARAHGMPGI